MSLNSWKNLLIGFFLVAAVVGEVLLLQEKDMTPIEEQSVEMSSRSCKTESEICFSDYHCCSKLCSSEGRCVNPVAELSCRRNGVSCLDHNECCSGSCFEGQCFPNAEHLSRVGEPCLYSDGCQSGYCGSEGRCKATENDCLPVGIRAQNSYECCSKSVVAGICVGSSLQLAPSGAECVNNYECASGGCIDHRCR